MSSRFCIVLLIVNIFSDVSALVELPQVEENHILETETAIRQTTNNLFSLLKLKVNKERPILKQYSLIHNYLISTSLQDYTSLKEIAKLTRIDKTRLNNETQNFMAIVNEILNEDIKHDTGTEDEYVIRHIEGFLTNLDKYTDTYEYNENSVDIIIAEILNREENNDNFTKTYNNTLDSDNNLLKSDENETLIKDNDYWVPNARRIFQGKKTHIRDFPFMASIQVFNHFQCAGSIIKSDLIITAASCVQLTWNNRFFRENPSFLSARVGSTFHNGEGENVPVLEIYFYPDYDPTTLRHNLCLLRLLRQLRFKKSKGGRLKKIDFDRKPTSVPVVTFGGTGLDITIVGWGAKGLGTSIIKDSHLSFAVLDIYSLQECQAVYSAKYVTQKHFCAGFVSHGGGACNRDIGGPGIMHGILVGVISFGTPTCGTPNAPTVFTKVGYYADWIEGIMRQDVSKALKRTTLLTTYPVRYATLIPPKTTFKLQPPLGNRKPKSVNELDMLRSLKDKGLLRQFVNSVIGSEEAKMLIREIKRLEETHVQSKPGEKNSITHAPAAKSKPPLLKTESKLKAKNISKSISNDDISEENTHETSEISDKTSDETTDESTDKNEDIDAQIEDGIIDIVDRLKLKKNVGDNKKVNNQKKIIKTDKRGGNKKTGNISIVYLTESEEDTSSASSEDSDDSGLDIVDNEFTDPTYRNNETNVDVIVSKQELLELFSEALREETKTEKNTTIKTTTVNYKTKTKKTTKKIKKTKNGLKKGKKTANQKKKKKKQQ